MIVKVRTHPIDVFYATGSDAREAREAAGYEQGLFSPVPCFVTASFGHDGFVWATAEDFEAEYSDGPGQDDPRWTLTESA